MALPKYVPILRAKRGEFQALTNLSPAAWSHVVPLLDLPKPKVAVAPGSPVHSVDAHLVKLIDDISEACAGRRVFVDTFAWMPSATTDEGEYVLPFVATKLQTAGVHVNPVIGYDRWDDPDYQLSCSSIELSEGNAFCLRFDREAIEDMADSSYFAEKVTDMLASLGCTAKQCFALVDLDDVSHQPVVDLLPTATEAVEVLTALGFEQLVLAGSSIPPSIADAVEKTDSVGYVSRREILVWQTLLADFPRLIFGDYGIRSPRSQDDVIAPHINGKIRYTTDKRCFIARGHSMQKGAKGEQNYALAKAVVSSPHYVGPQFSWGDAQILACSNEHFKGNSTQWIAIDTNHHIESTVMEVTESLSSLRVDKTKEAV